MAAEFGQRVLETPGNSISVGEFFVYMQLCVCVCVCVSVCTRVCV